MRITGGQARGRAISGPEGLEVRPTGSKVRQAFFNILSNKVEGARFLDICAGSGLMGMEALSRGAAELIAIEENKKMAQAIRANLARFNFEGEVICADACKVLPILEVHGADIAFADPPYKSNLLPTILALFEEHKLLHPAGVLAFEHDAGMAVPGETEGLVNFDSRKYGQTKVSFYRYKTTDSLDK